MNVNVNMNELIKPISSKLIIPQLYEIRNGKHIGRKSRERYIWWECPKCSKRGWANIYKLLSNPAMGLCDKCYNFDNNEYRNIICDRTKSLSFGHPEPTINYRGQSFYFFEGPKVLMEPKKELRYEKLKPKEQQKKEHGAYIEIYRNDWFDDSNNPIVSKWGLEHRYIVEKRIRHKILQGMIIHHLNGDKKNNNPDNLSNPISRKEHSLVIPILTSRIMQLEKENNGQEDYIKLLENNL